MLHLQPPGNWSLVDQELTEKIYLDSLYLRLHLLLTMGCSPWCPWLLIATLLWSLPLSSHALDATAGLEGAPQVVPPQLQDRRSLRGAFPALRRALEGPDSEPQLPIFPAQDPPTYGGSQPDTSTGPFPDPAPASPQDPHKRRHDGMAGLRRSRMLLPVVVPSYP